MTIKKVGDKWKVDIWPNGREGKRKIAFVSLAPESLRNYVEEELINRNPISTWNRENA